MKRFKLFNCERTGTSTEWKPVAVGCNCDSDDFKNKRTKGYEYVRLYTDFLSEVLIFAYQLPYHRLHKNQQWHRKAALYSLNTISINVMYIDRV